MNLSIKNNYLRDGNKKNQRESSMAKNEIVGSDNWVLMIVRTGLLDRICFSPIGEIPFLDVFQDSHWKGYD